MAVVHLVLQTMKSGAFSLANGAFTVTIHENFCKRIAYGHITDLTRESVICKFHVSKRKKQSGGIAVERRLQICAQTALSLYSAA